jgi:hypothetical protein
MFLNRRITLHHPNQSASAMAAVILAALVLAPPGRGAELSGQALAEALRHGGYVVLMRHAHSPDTPPAKPSPGDPDHERELDATGQSTASAMGAAIRALHIRVGEVWSSPTYRALQTIRLAGLPKPRTEQALGDHGQSMQAATGEQSAWLRGKLAQAPRKGADTFIVTQAPNIVGALGTAASGLTDGEALVFRPRSAAGSQLVGRIRIEDWPSLAARSGR